MDDIKVELKNGMPLKGDDYIIAPGSVIMFDLKGTEESQVGVRYKAGGLVIETEKLESSAGEISLRISANFLEPGREVELFLKNGVTGNESKALIGKTLDSLLINFGAQEILEKIVEEISGRNFISIRGAKSDARSIVSKVLSLKQVSLWCPSESHSNGLDIYLSNRLLVSNAEFAMIAKQEGFSPMEEFEAKARDLAEYLIRATIIRKNPTYHPLTREIFLRDWLKNGDGGLNKEFLKQVDVVVEKSREVRISQQKNGTFPTLLYMQLGEAYGKLGCQGGPEVLLNFYNPEFYSDWSDSRDVGVSPKKVIERLLEIQEEIRGFRTEKKVSGFSFGDKRDGSSGTFEMNVIFMSDYEPRPKSVDSPKADLKEKQ